MDDPSLRVSDADREEVIVTLREHLLAGRLTLEEFSERVDAALRARVGGELARVQDDLPRIFRETAGSHRKPARFTTALLGHVGTVDIWRVPYDLHGRSYHDVIRQLHPRSEGQAELGT